MFRLKFLVCISLLSQVLWADTSNFCTKENMLKDLEIIESSFEVKYAPKEWKYAYLGWDLRSAIDRSKEKVISSSDPSVRDYQKIVKQFFKSMQDYHVTVHFSNTEMSRLPFVVRGANNRYFVTAVEEEFDLFSVGDEILSIGGIPVTSIVDDILMSDFGPLQTRSDRSLAESMITLRMAATGIEVPQGDVVVKIKSQDSGKIQDIALTWTHYPEMIKGINLTNDISYDTEIKLDNSFFKHPLFNRKWKTPFATLMSRAKNIMSIHHGKTPENKPFIHETIGYLKSRLPRLGKVRWELNDSEFFDAYIYETPKKELVGFIRIPSFDPDDTEEAAEEFEAIIKFFETHTSCLVIDQLDNPGGDMFYMYGLLSKLSKIPLKVFSDRETLTQQDVMAKVEMNLFLNLILDNSDLFDIQELFGDSFSGYPVDLNLIRGIRDYFQFLVNEWNSGRRFSDANYIYGIKSIKPNQKSRYSKPILLLINELDFSCGDMFPSILQDNKRATLMGQTTAGAGGYVIPNQYYNLFGVANYTITGSIAERINGEKIENIGVKPDIPYELTTQDLQNSFIDYASEICKQVEILIKK